ncbi:SNF1-related protein kinase regulatory subunit beta-1-like [Macadamia integrifolia]|uniref:SNF1-related protein kinase regulatory subunit beta-1-like n=1 Tax=Macadamia integrifolia TaxID=60698 RepID=UPI001C4FDF62|nr:SNF1-related protein kinase regulatory subunit beta-1-like [Macadamia integrifolia]
MGNANGKEEGENGSEDPSGQSNAESGYNNDFPVNSYHPARVNSVDSMGNSPPLSPGRSQPPPMFAPQVPVPPLQRGETSVFNQLWVDESHGDLDVPTEQGIPTMITWTYGGNNVAVKGSWDNWTSRKMLQRSGIDHSLLLVLPSGIYQYKFIVDSEWRYIPDLPCIADETGNICNLLDVHDYVSENPESVAEFEPPPSPDSSYGQVFPVEDFAKEPIAVPPQLQLTVLGMPHSAEYSTKPQHVVLNHLFIEKGWASQSLVALRLTHRFQSKYVTVVLYKPLRR